MKKLLKAANNEKGQGMVEYVLIVGLVVGIIVLVGPKLRTYLDNKMGQITSNADKIDQ